jgi:hypothetical protein
MGHTSNGSPAMTRFTNVIAHVLAQLNVAYWSEGPLRGCSFFIELVQFPTTLGDAEPIGHD